MPKRRIDRKSSRTAGFTCMLRAASYLEKDVHYRSDDHIALRLLPFPVRFLVRQRLIHFKGSFSPKGIYEYVIARTKYVDTVLREEMEKGIDQIVILGAGFDSRAVRFDNINTKTTFFELDSVHTQTAKIRRFRKKGISFPDTTKYIPIDFNADSISDVLLQNGFSPDRRSIFLMEGLVMYLKNDAVRELFETVSALSSDGSGAVFDYIHASVLQRENRYYGEKEIYDRVNGVNESWQFGMEKGAVAGFVNGYGFRLVENLDSDELEKMFFTDTTGNRAGRINGTHCIACIKRD